MNYEPSKLYLGVWLHKPIIHRKTQKVVSIDRILLGVCGWREEPYQELWTKNGSFELGTREKIVIKPIYVNWQCQDVFITDENLLDRYSPLDLQPLFDEWINP